MIFPAAVENPFVFNISFLSELCSLMWQLDYLLFFSPDNLFRLPGGICCNPGIISVTVFLLLVQLKTSLKRHGLRIVSLYLFTCLYYVQGISGWLAGRRHQKGFWGLTTSQPCALVVAKDNSLLGCIRRSISTVTRWSLSFHSAVLRHIWKSGFSSAFSSLRDIELQKQASWRTMRISEGLVHLSNMERLRELALFSLEKRSLVRSALSMCVTVSWGCKTNGAILFLGVCEERARSNGLKLKYKKSI